MDLSDFMALVGATLEDVALATGMNISTVSRLRAGITRNPKWQTLERVQSWADAEHRRHKLRPRQRLTWDYLREDAA